MEVTVAMLWALSLLTLCVVAWALNLIALPGNWIVVALVGLYVWLGPEEGRVALSWQLAVGTFIVALVGELIEFLAGAVGAQRAGASRRSTLLAVVGSLVGALVGAVVGLPIPVVGSVLAALLFGSAGATAGAMYGEWTNGKSWRDSWTVGHAAFWGRLLGTLGKLSSGLVILLAVLAGLVI